MILPNHPVLSLDRVCTRAVPALTIINADPVTNQMARVSTTADPTGATATVVLTAIASAVTSTFAVSAATYPTLAAMIGAEAGRQRWPV